jgi:hypothetical protein
MRSSDAHAIEQDEALATFQRALMELLAREEPPQVMLAALRTDAAFAPFRDWVDQLDVRGIETAAALMKRWGRRA